MVGMVTVFHLGSLHPVETLLVFLVAFGPFVALVAYTVVKARSDGPVDTGDDTPARVDAPSHATSEDQ
jgi:hypothetical protein